MEKKMDNTSEVDLFEYLFILWRCKFVIIFGTTIITMLLGIFALNKYNKTPEIYTSRILLQPAKGDESSGKAIFMDSPKELIRHIETHEVKLKINKEISEGRISPGRILLDAAPIGNSGIIKVDYHSTTPGEGVHILQALKKVLTEYYKKRIADANAEIDLKLKPTMEKLERNVLRDKSITAYFKNQKKLVSNKNKEKVNDITRSIELLKIKEKTTIEKINALKMIIAQTDNRIKTNHEFIQKLLDSSPNNNSSEKRSDSTLNKILVLQAKALTEELSIDKSAFLMQLKEYMGEKELIAKEIYLFQQSETTGKEELIANAEKEITGSVETLSKRGFVSVDAVVLFDIRQFIEKLEARIERMNKAKSSFANIKAIMPIYEIATIPSRDINHKIKYGAAISFLLMVCFVFFCEKVQNLKGKETIWQIAAKVITKEKNETPQQK